MNGLTSFEVEERIKNNKTNKIVEIEKKSLGQIFCGHIFTYFNLLNLLVFIAVLFTGSFRNTLFMGIVISNALIGIVDEIILRKKLDKLSYFTEKKSTVIRDGGEKQILSSEIVTDDLISLKTGDEIPCDCVILETNFLEVNESLVTGESDPILKKNNDKLISGSFLVSGECLAKAVNVGNSSYSNKIYDEAKKYKKIESEIVGSINTIIKVMTIVILPLGVILFTSSYFRDGKDIHEAILGAGGSIIGMIPSGLYLITTLTAVMSVMRLIRRKALVNEFSAIEKLSRVNMICFDKTGTLTTGEMKVDESIEYDGYNPEILKLICKTFVNKNATLTAIYNKFGDKTDLSAEAFIPFSSERKYLEISLNGDVYKLGAADFIADNKEIIEEASRFSDAGKRVLLLTKNGAALCMIILSEVINQSANAVMKYFKQQDISMKIISGDNPKTVHSIVSQLDFSANMRYVDLSKQVKTLENYKKLALKYSIFGRVKPDEKKLLIKALRDNGKTVAMVGDGVNDILALKEADLGIAMAGGVNAIKSVAQIILMEQDFSCLPDVLKEGRRIVNNIEMVASLYLNKTVFSLIITIMFIFLGMTYPLSPIFLTVIGGCTIGIPSFFLAFRSNDKPVSENFLKNIINKSLPTGLLISLFVGFFGILKLTGSIENMETMVFFITAYFCFFKLLKTSLPMNYYKGALISVTLCIFCVLTMVSGLISISYLENKELLFLCIAMLLGTVLLSLHNEN